MLEDYINQVICGDCLKIMADFPDNSVDLVLTDPPYGYSFMGKDWDKAVPSVDIWKECLRVLKPGGWCLVMSAPRQDVLSRMIVNLSDAGFRTDFTSIYWCYASGFPKASNIGKLVDKRAGVERPRTKVIQPRSDLHGTRPWIDKAKAEGKYKVADDKPITPEAKALDGSYAGFQPKPAVEVILVCMKPLSEKTYVDQALKNGRGITWLDDCRIPYESEDDKDATKVGHKKDAKYKTYMEGQGRDLNKESPTLNRQIINSQGRFPANLLVSDDVLNDGREHLSGGGNKNKNPKKLFGTTFKSGDDKNWNPDSGSFSRYFDLDAWARENGFPEADMFGERELSPLDTFPFLIVPKASKSEKNKGLEGLEEKPKWLKGGIGTGISARESIVARNFHPTCKPCKLMRYLITLASREGDLVLDPFAGTSTAAVECEILKRDYIMIELSPEYVKLSNKRLEPYRSQRKLNLD